MLYDSRSPTCVVEGVVNSPRNVIKYRAEIEAALLQLYGPEEYALREDVIDGVFDGYAVLGTDEAYFADASGEDTQKLIEGEGSVISVLTSGHREAFLVVNDVEGTTFSQPEFDRLLRGSLDIKEDDTEAQTPEVFVVDVWRGKQYADFIANLAVENGISDRETARQKAYADFLIRTLATSATLTAGDQAVMVHKPKGQGSFALAAA